MENEKGNKLESITMSTVRIGLAAIPYVGGVLAQGLSEWDGYRKDQRIKEFIILVQKRFEELNFFHQIKDMKDEDWLLLEHLIRKVQYEHRETKRKRYADFIVHSWNKKNIDPFEKKQKFLEAIEYFSELHISVLVYLNECAPPFYPTVNDIKKKFGITNHKAELYPILQDLAGKYFFMDRSWTLGTHNAVAPVLSCGNLSPENLASKCKHKITELGKEFLEYIRSCDDLTQDKSANT